jgi:hypothetical protein
MNCVGKTIFSVIAACLMLMATTPQSASAGTLSEGRYEGFLKLPSLGMKIPMTLDLAKSTSSDGSGTQFDVWTKLSFGGFRSHEYMTHHYVVKSQDTANGQLDLSVHNGVRDIQWNLRASDDVEVITGGFASNRENVRDGLVELHLRCAGDATKECLPSKSATIFPETPIYPMLTGTYSCPKCSMFTGIQLEISRSEKNLEPYTWPVEGGEVIFNINYEVRGRLFGPLLEGIDEILESDMPTDGVKASITSNTSLEYSVFSGQLHFPRTYMKTCSIKPNGLNCTTGFYPADAGEASFRQKLLHQSIPENHLPIAANKNSEEKNISPSSLSADVNGGTWQGMIHLETRDVTMPLTIEVVLDNQSTQKTLAIGNQPIAFIPKLHYVTVDPTKPLPHFFQFNLLPIQLPEQGSVFASGQRGEAIKLVTWTKESMSGILFGADQGRIGTFELKRAHPGDKPVAYKSEAPLTYLSEAERDPKDPSRFYQTTLELDWSNGWSGQVPMPMLFGRLVTHFERIMTSIPTNVLQDAFLRSMRFDPFTGVFGTDVGSDSTDDSSILGLLDQDQVVIARSSNVFGINPQSRAHKMTVLKPGRPYVQPQLPNFNELPRHCIHIFMPHNAILYVNGQRMGDNRLVHRRFAWPKAWKGEALTYKLKAEFLNGKSYETSVTVTRDLVNQRPVVINFYSNQ